MQMRTTVQIRDATDMRRTKLHCLDRADVRTSVSKRRSTSADGPDPVPRLAILTRLNAHAATDRRRPTPVRHLAPNRSVSQFQVCILECQ
jgi:hypothetical protein